MKNKMEQIDEDFFKSSSQDWKISEGTSCGKELIYADAFLKHDVNVVLICHPEKAFCWTFQTIVAGYIDGSEQNVFYSTADLAYKTALEKIIERNL